MTHLQKITTLAKKIRKAKPALKWTDAIKQASKQIKPAAKKIAVKKAAKKIGALPIGFKGSIFGVNFKVVNQYDIYNNVSAIVEDTKTGKTIVVFDGKKSAKELGFNFAKYIVNHFNGNIGDVDFKQLEARLTKFCVQMQKEVKAFNSGSTKTIKKQPLVIAAPKKAAAPVKKAAPKKAAKKVHTIWKTVPEHKRRVAGYDKPAIATKLQHYSWLTGRETGLKGVIDQIKSEKPLTPAKRKEILFYQKQLKAVQAQKAIEKRII